MKSKRIISSLMAALASTSSLMATKGNLKFRSKGGDTYTNRVLNTNVKRGRRLRTIDTKGQKPSNFSLSGSNVKDTVTSVAKSNQSDKAKEMLYSAGRWMKNNPKKTIGYSVLAATGSHVLVRGGNELIRLPIIYKDNGKNFESGLGASNVVEVVKRFGDISRKLVRKRIRRIFSFGYLNGDFDSEKLACKMLAEWSKEKENEKIFKHIARVVDYHYGLGNLYVTYEEAGGVDWEKQGINNWTYDEKLDWLHKVCEQVIDVALFFHGKGFYHGDLHCLNYNTSGAKENPHVNVFDFGRFYKVKEMGKNLPGKCPGWDLNQILKGFIALAVSIFGANTYKEKLLEGTIFEKERDRMRCENTEGEISYGKNAMCTVAAELELNTTKCVGYLKNRDFYKDKFVGAVIDMFLKNRDNLDILVKKLPDGTPLSVVPKTDGLSDEEFKNKLSHLKQLLS